MCCWPPHSGRRAFGLVTREARTAGLWVVASDRGAIGEEIVDDVDGFRIDVSGPDALLRVLRLIDKNPQRFLHSPPPPSVSPRTMPDQARTSWLSTRGSGPIEGDLDGSNIVRRRFESRDFDVTVEARPIHISLSDESKNLSFIKIDFAGHSFQLDASDDMDLVARQIASGGYEAPLPFLMMATLLRTEVFSSMSAPTPASTRSWPAR